MGGCAAIPGFCSCGFIPRPSGGTQSRRSKGLAPNASVMRKNSAHTASVPVTHGISARLRCRLVNTATAA